MLDATPTLLQRTRGTAAIGFGPEGRVTELFQQGSAKAMLPRTHAAMPEAVFLNTAGGLTGGDVLRYGVTLAPGARIVATTQTAERAYRAGAGTASLDVTLRVGASAHLDWLPQETILFDGAAFARTTRIDLEDGASCLFAEMITLGRRAMGERVATVDLVDRRIVTRDGRPVFVDPLRIASDDLRRRDAAGFDQATALASLVYVGADAEDRLSALRAAFPDARASAWDGKLVWRDMDGDPRPLRLRLAALLTHLRGAPLPRVWQY